MLSISASNYAAKVPDSRIICLIAELGKTLSTMSDAESIIRFCLAEFIPHFSLADFVIYKYNPSQNTLQKCASLNKFYFDLNEPYKDLILTPGQGVVGQTAMVKSTLLINNTETFEGYVIDDERRYSELSCPVLYKNRLIGVLDSENSEKGYFNRDLQQTFEILSVLIAPHLKEIGYPKGQNIYYQRFLDMLSEDNIYLDNELNLEKVASKLELTSGHFSAIINEYSKDGFRALINRARVSHFINLATTTRSGNSLLSLAYASGFNSKATFNRAFKNHTGSSPLSYLKEKSALPKK
ncbi:MAG: helix-turn-helix domain-containing protein [Cyclobacteriaceae bacterium]